MMVRRIQSFLSDVRSAFDLLFSGPQSAALVPALVLAGYWLGGEQLLIALAIGLPALLYVTRRATSRHRKTDSHDGPDNAGPFQNRLQTSLAKAHRESMSCGCFLIALDDFATMRDRYGTTATHQVVLRCKERAASVLRSADMVFVLQSGQLAVVPSPVPTLDINDAHAIAERLQRAIEEPVTVEATTIYLSASLGFALASQIENVSAERLATAARTALRDARRHAPSALRAYVPGMKSPSIARDAIALETVNALKTGQILPWFQPQVCTHTGQITGFEALARWDHPDRGLIPPADFLPVVEQTGKLGALGDVILEQSLNALKTWDRAGLIVPGVGVNLSSDELRNPKLVDKIRWELDRFDLTPERLTLEVLETVAAASADDTIARNINALATLGCRIDLDDFGTGNASICALKRFVIHRLKIDRSFVMRVDRDPDQQRMISTILLMAERLGLDTLAEGVETAGEHSMLAQLGCNHVQGFGVCRPIPFDQTVPWAVEHLQKVGPPPLTGRKIV